MVRVRAWPYDQSAISLQRHGRQQYIQQLQQIRETGYDTTRQETLQ